MGNSQDKERRLGIIKTSVIEREKVAECQHFHQAQLKELQRKRLQEKGSLKLGIVKSYFVMF